MPDNAEARRAPRGHEEIDFVPAVEADAEAFVFQDAIHFCKGRLEPAIIVVVGDTAAGAVAIVHEIRRIGQNEIDAVGWESTHEADAIAQQDGVDGIETAAAHGAPPFAWAMMACAWSKRSAGISPSSV